MGEPVALAEYADALEAGCDASELPGALRERIEDALRPESVAAAVRAATSPGGGEPQRRRVRSVIEPWLDRAAWAPATELADREPGPDPRLATEPDLRARRRLYAERVELLERLGTLRGEWISARAEAAERIGLGSVTEVYASGHPVPPAATAEAFEIGAIAPLDDAIAAAVQERRRDWPTPLHQPPDPADALYLRAASGFAGELDTGAIARMLARTSAGLHLECGVSEGGGIASTMLLDGDGVPLVALGAVASPGTLVGALAALGATLRASFLRRARGAACWRFADPAFAHAAAVLFRRLALSPVYRQVHGPRSEGGLHRALALEEALAPRRAWNYLGGVISGQTHLAPAGGDDACDSGSRRATGEPATADERVGLSDSNPVGAAILRGTVLALLQEERLLSRFGYGWFANRGAAGWLLETWEAEPDETAESMAAAADLGTIEPTPIVDRCRPPG